MREAAFGALLIASFAAGCSLALNFDDIDNLRCPCLPSHVCLVSADRCVKKNSVEDFKSCDPDAETPDDLCKPGSICINFQEKGPRCLPQCTPSAYTTPEASTEIGLECPLGYTCWSSVRDGVCSEGVCDDLRQNCGGGQRCVSFNGTGVCFTTCRIFVANSCAGDLTCHPVGSAGIAACAQTGQRDLGEVCTHKDPCKKTGGNPPRPLVCDKPEQSTDLRRCLPICQCQGGNCPNVGCATGESCLFARPGIDVDSQSDLGVCVRS